MKLTSINNKVLILPLLLTLGVIQGCASVSPEQLNNVKAVADQALQTAQQADQNAATANAAAKAAADKADSASAKADQADQKADLALQQIKDLNEKVDRMFEKSMKK
jgi:methyl-accepting chemotaxis protein